MLSGIEPIGLAKLTQSAVRRMLKLIELHGL